MTTTILSQPYKAFTYIVDKEIKIEDKIKDFPRICLNSIKIIKHVPSKIVNFIKENKFTLALAAISLTISMVVFVKVSATAAILFLGAVSFVKAYGYTRAYVKSSDYQFKKLAKNYINSLEKICESYKNGIQLPSDLEAGKIVEKFYNFQKQLMRFVLNNAKNYSQRDQWKHYLENSNPNLVLFQLSFPLYNFVPINNNAFKKSPSIAFSIYNKELFKYIDSKAAKDLKKQLLEFSKTLNPKSATLKEKILKHSKTINSFLQDVTKNTIAIGVCKEIVSATNPGMFSFFSSKQKK